MGIDLLSYDTNILKELKNPNNYMDSVAEAQVLGAFMNNADLLINNACKVEASDFNLLINSTIYGHMTSIIRDGGLVIQASDIKKLFYEDAMGRKLYNDCGGDKYLSDITLYAEPQNLQMHAANLKKWSLLRMYVRAGIDVTYYHIPVNLVNDLFDIRDKRVTARTANEWEAEVNRRFESTSLEKMMEHFLTAISGVNDKFSNHENEFVVAGGPEAYSNIEEWQAGTSYGFGRPSQLFTNVTGGLKRGKYTVYSSGSGFGKSRLAIASMCFPYLPKYWDEESNAWIDNPNGNNNKALYIGTEMGIRDEVEPILIAYMTNIEQNRIQKKQGLTKEERKRCKEATEFLWNGQSTESGGGLYLAYMPDYTIASLEATICKYKQQCGISAVFFDYIMTTTPLLAEFQEKAGRMSVREDQVLANVSLKLKELAQRLDIAIETSTQITGDSADSKNRNVSIVRGSKAIIDKCDTAVIITAPNSVENDLFDKLFEESRSKGYKTSFPGRQHDRSNSISPQGQGVDLVEESARGTRYKRRIFTVYKNRGGMWNDVKIWLIVDYSTMRVHDAFATDLKNVLISGLGRIYTKVDEKGEIQAYEEKPSLREYEVPSKKAYKEAAKAILENTKLTNGETGEMYNEMYKDIPDEEDWY